MTDIEHALRESLHAYGGSIEPCPPPAPVRAVEVGRRRLLVSAAAVSLAGASIGGLWWLADARRDGTARLAMSGQGRWSVPSPSPLSPRQFPAVFWTGDEFIVWGGVIGNAGLTDGARYDPTSDTWRSMSDPIGVRPGGAAVWAGDRMVVVSEFAADAYDPRTDTWSTVATLDPADRADGTTGFTDVVWTGTDLIALGIRPGNGGTATMSAWHLDNSRWMFAGSINTIGAPRQRYQTVADQLGVHDPIALGDGCTLWDGTGHGWRFTLGAGWTQLPVLDAYDQTGALITDSRLAAVGDRLVMVAEGRTADRDDLRITTLAGDSWGDWAVGPDRAVLLIARIVPLGDRLVLLGASPDGSPTPLLVDPATAASTPMTGYPIDTVIDQGAGWSGQQLLVVGGQRSSGDGTHSTGDTGTVSASVALWTAP